MPTFSNKRRVRHSAADMFDLVADVEHYPEFVPMCKALKVRQRTPRGRAIEIVVADMTVSFKLVRETFRSRVTLDRPKLQILVEYLQGPFSHMQNRWTFRPLGDQVLRGRVLHRLRVSQPHARHADGRHVRCGLPPLRRGLRGARRPGLRRKTGLACWPIRAASPAPPAPTAAAPRRVRCRRIAARDE